MSNRKFRLRNGMVVEEWLDANFVGVTNRRAGFIDDYKILNFNGVEVKGKSAGSGADSKNRYLCLVLDDGGFPRGGAWGPEFDIVEEILD